MTMSPAMMICAVLGLGCAIPVTALPDAPGTNPPPTLVRVFRQEERALRHLILPPALAASPPPIAVAPVTPPLVPTLPTVPLILPQPFISPRPPVISGPTGVLPPQTYGGGGGTVGPPTGGSFGSPPQQGGSFGGGRPRGGSFGNGWPP